MADTNNKPDVAEVDWCHSDNEDDMATAYMLPSGAEMVIRCPPSGDDFFIETIDTKVTANIAHCVTHAAEMAQIQSKSVVVVEDATDTLVVGDDTNGALAAEAGGEEWPGRFGFTAAAPGTNGKKRWTATASVLLGAA